MCHDAGLFYSLGHSYLDISQFHRQELNVWL
ncbi:hypothetical protein PANT111_100113 [Pantoea brenneri]|uniref:Transposase n=1 Tax=Pantoea brenneri TaxID=472694 RepID=A0AAX3J088_9GAMM|nr:hypothetical protein PANT111_100113 [Pantoea brenneri]